MKRALNDYRRIDGEFRYPKGHDNSGLLAHIEEEEAASQGSLELSERIQRQFRKFAWRYGISEDEARHLLLNTGVKLPKTFMLVAAE